MAALLLACCAPAAIAADAEREQFGELDGKPVPAVTLTSKGGVTARIIAYGAALQSLQAPDRSGNKTDIVLGYDDIGGYTHDIAYFGSIVGRYANRISGGSFTLDRKRYSLSRNDGENSLHGGRRGYDKVLWNLDSISSGEEATATFTYRSPDGEEGYPGTVDIRVTYALNNRNELSIRYSATTDKPTIVNLANHAYFNLAGAASGQDILGHFLTLKAGHFTPVDAGLIPTGELRPVAGTAFDFQQPTPIGARVRDGGEPQIMRARGYDHNFVLDAGVTEQPKLAARVEEPQSGRVLELLTTEPGVQFYSGNFLDGRIVGKQGMVYRQSAGLALEPQHFPDTPNQPAFPTVRLEPGQTYRQVSIYRFTTMARTP